MIVKIPTAITIPIYMLGGFMLAQFVRTGHPFLAVLMGAIVTGTFVLRIMAISKGYYD